MSAHNLVQAYIEIKEYLKSHADPNQRAFLENVQQQIAAFIQAMTEILALKPAEVTRLNANYSHQLILEYRRSSYQQSLSVDPNYITNIQSQILSALTDRPAGTYRALLEFLYHCCNSSLTVVIRDREKNIEENLESWSLANPLYRSCRDIGGFFFPLMQNCDPLIGDDFKGNCLGYVHIWALAIIKNKPMSYLASTPEIQHRQNLFGITLGRDETMVCHKKEFGENIFSFLLVMLNSMQENTIYKFRYNEFIMSHTCLSHVMGVRKIPQSEHIEFLDPNNGLFIFPNQKTFILWVSIMLIFKYPYIMCIPNNSWELIMLGRQPPDVVNSTIINYHQMTMAQPDVSTPRLFRSILAFLELCLQKIVALRVNRYMIRYSMRSIISYMINLCQSDSEISALLLISQYQDDDTCESHPNVKALFQDPDIQQKIVQRRRELGATGTEYSL